MYFSAEKRKEMQGEIARLEGKLAKNPGDAESAGKLLELYVAVDDTNALGPFLEKSVAALADKPEFLSQAAVQGGAAGFGKASLKAAEALVAAKPADGEASLLLAVAALRNGDTNRSLEAAREAVAKGGLAMREELKNSPEFDKLRNEPEFKKIAGE
jgi:thioredoxin-like negative regulator of GroEL